MGKTKKEDRVGRPIRFIGGVHEGKEGFINDGKKGKDGWVYVIVQEEKEDGSLSMYPTRVQRLSIAEPLQAEPKNDAEALLRYHKDIDKLLYELTKKMSKCQKSNRGTSSSSRTSMQFFWKG